jgi:hypothetical protein
MYQQCVWTTQKYGELNIRCDSISPRSYAAWIQDTTRRHRS